MNTFPPPIWRPRPLCTLARPFAPMPADRPTASLSQVPPVLLSGQGRDSCWPSRHDDQLADSPHEAGVNSAKAESAGWFVVFISIVVITAVALVAVGTLKFAEWLGHLQR